MRYFCDRVAAFSDTKLRASTLAVLGNLLWKSDEALARQLFQRSIDVLTNPAETKLTTRERLSLRRKVLSLAMRSNEALAESLTEALKANDLNSSPTLAMLSVELDTAYELLSVDPDRAEYFATRSLAQDVPALMPSFLLQYRAQVKSPTADALFLQSIRRLPAQRNFDLSLLPMYGTYVFTSPALDQNDLTSVSLLRVGSSSIALADISADRLNVSANLTVAYLQAAVQVLSSKANNSNRPELVYAVAYLLRPKIQKHAPQLLASLEQSLSTLTNQVSPELRNESSYKNFGQSRPAFDDELAQIEKLEGAMQRDARYLSLFYEKWIHNDFRRARVLIDRISDLQVQQTLKVLTDFIEASGWLRGGEEELEKARSVASRLPKGLEKSSLWLGLGRDYLTNKQHELATEALNEALKAAEADTDGRPLFLLIAARYLGQLDPSVSDATLMTAVKEFNKQPALAVAGFNPRRLVTAGSHTVAFPISLDGINFGFAENLRFLLEQNFENTHTQIMNLVNEEHFAAGILCESKLLIELNLPSPSAAIRAARRLETDFYSYTGTH